MIADTATRALVLPKSQFERIVAAEPRHIRHFSRLLADRYAALLQILAAAHGLTPMDRLRSRLAETIDLKHRDRKASEPQSLNISQSELATMVGVSHQKLNGLLKALEAAWLVELGFRRIRVPDPARLRGRDAETSEHCSACREEDEQRE